MPMTMSTRRWLVDAADLDHVLVRVALPSSLTLCNSTL